MSEERDKHGLRPSAYRDYEPDEVAKAMTEEIEKLKEERKSAPWPRNHEIRGEIAALKTERSRYELAQMARM